jgi:hypothetical protein
MLSSLTLPTGDSNPWSMENANQLAILIHGLWETQINWFNANKGPNQPILALNNDWSVFIGILAHGLGSHPSQA